MSQVKTDELKREFENCHKRILINKSDARRAPLTEEKIVEYAKQLTTSYNDFVSFVASIYTSLNRSAQENIENKFESTHKKN